MDEPTSVLTPQETNQLFAVLRRFADKGMAVLFISHKLDEIRALTSRATVLRRGRNVGTMDTKGKSNRQLAELMVGSEVADISRHKEPAELAESAKLSEPLGAPRCVASQNYSARNQPRLRCRLMILAFAQMQVKFWPSPVFPEMVKTS
jgi:ABC-type sugar transport system ATPase subunit